MEAAAHEEPSQEQVPGKSCDLWRAAYTGPDVLTVVAHEGPMLEKSVSKGLCPVERTMLKKSWERLYCLGGILCWSREKE